MKSLYVSDLDGTLLDSRARLSASARDRLQRLLADGIDFTVASARGVASMQAALTGLRLRLPVIGFNGAFLSDLVSGRHEVVHSIEPGLAADLHALIEQHGVPPLIATFNGSEDCVYYVEPRNEGMHWYVRDRIANRDNRLRKLDDAARALTEQVVCLTGIGPGPAMAEVAARIGQEFSGAVELHVFENWYSPGWYWLTVHDRRASKDQAVRELMRRYDLGGHEVVAFGDEVNDLKLFDTAGEAVAVANAVPEVLARATRVIGSNEDDSVVEFIEQHFAGGAA